MTFKTPAKLARLLRGLASVPSKLSAPLAARLMERVRDCYTGEHDPYGAGWAPLAASTVRRKGGNSVILTRTGGSQADCGARPLSGGGVTVWAGGAAHHHMQAEGSRPARCVLPTRGMPPTWREDVRAVCGDAMAKALGRASR